MKTPNKIADELLATLEQNDCRGVLAVTRIGATEMPNGFYGTFEQAGTLIGAMAVGTAKDAPENGKGAEFFAGYMHGIKQADPVLCDTIGKVLMEALNHDE